MTHEGRLNGRKKGETIEIKGYCGKVWRVLKKSLKISYDPTISCLSISEENEKINLKGYMHPNIYSSIIYNSQDMEMISKYPSTEEQRFIL